MKPAFTLLELLVVLAILGLLLGVALPPVVRWADEAAVRAARNELAAALAQTRVTAVSHGGAALVLDPANGRFHSRTADGRQGEAEDLGRRYGVRLELGTDDPVLFRYDALGIGRLSNRTIRVRRRGAEAGLTVSLYGRVRRW